MLILRIIQEEVFDLIVVDIELNKEMIPRDRNL